MSSKPDYTAPHSPGIYVMKDGNGKVLYVGKAKNLKHRVDSYFLATVDSEKTARLVSRIRDIEFLVVHSEAEALVLENNLIKQFQPPFNVDLREGTRYAYVKVTNEEFPRLLTVRSSNVRKGEKIYGPFPYGLARARFTRLLQKSFRIRVCKVLPKHACLQYHLGYCSAPCIGKIGAEEYARDVDAVESVLKGNVNEVLSRVRGEMKSAASEQNFEAAIISRNQVFALERLSEVQDVERPNEGTEAIVGIANDGNRFAVQIFSVEGGVLRGRHSFVHDAVMGSEFASEFLRAFFGSRTIPPRIVLRALPEDAAGLAQWLSTWAGHKVELFSPQRGSSLHLLDLAEKNAHVVLSQPSAKTGSALVASEDVLDLQTALHLTVPPRSIECFDISHLFGNQVVGSMVRFVEGVPAKSDYRHFRIRTLTGKSDDPAAIKEVVFRRYSRLVREGAQLPDLVVIDGGKGQLNAALQSLSDMGVDLPVISLAKRMEEIYSPDEMEPLRLEHSRAGLKLLQRIRDEAHRFAVTFHRTLRGKDALAEKKEFVYQ